MSTEERMDRIESKIDKLSEVLVQMARVEERILNGEEQHKEIRSDIRKLNDKVGEMEKVVQKNQITVNIINRISWIIITGVVGGFGTLITYLFNK
jgi:RecA/RadA recombinase